MNEPALFLPPPGPDDDGEPVVLHIHANTDMCYPPSAPDTKDQRYGSLRTSDLFFWSPDSNRR
uniref:Uncharacterized protein n=1 Tax=Candidatus Kentrum eta TaxID=2126337 RepID=A0A450UJA8_9GAMM|nr:MAG: hypothetical protein BECKH772B_GA0070898_1003128 [Candidatus Kentron sp. H]